MRGRFFLQLIILCCIFIVAMVLEIAPWPLQLQSFKPAWLVLVLTYWIIAMPDKINIGSAFVLGIIWDLILGSTLGIHALVLSIYAYVISKNYLIFRNFSLWQQSLLLVFFIFIIRIGIFLVEFFLNSAMFNWQEIFGALTSGLIWPWIFLLLRKTRIQLELR